MTASFVYDGDGNRVKGNVNGTTTAYVGNYFEWTGSASTMKKYYYAGSLRLAMRTGTTLSWILSDHLGSTNVVTDANGANPVYERYKPWGETRLGSPLPTKYTFTGQYSNVTDFGLMYYNARYYDPQLGRWLSPDTIVPEGVQGTQAWDRYAYSNNSPVVYNDPSGHSVDCAVGEENCEAGVYVPPQPNLLEENGWDLIPILSNMRGIVRGSQRASSAAQQPGFADEQAALQGWYNECYGGCHYPDYVDNGPGYSSVGGPMPNTPLVDTYSQGMGEAANGVVSLAIDAAYAGSTTNIFVYGGPSWHVGWQTNAEESLLHLDNAPGRGIHIALGYTGPRKAFLHIYVYPEPYIWWPGGPADGISFRIPSWEP